MICFDTFFYCNADFNSPMLFFVEACLQLPKGSYTAYKQPRSLTKALTK